MSSGKKIIWISAFLLVIASIGVWYVSDSTQPTYNYNQVQKGTVIEEVSVTGKIRAVHDVRLAFEKSGKIARVYAHVGDRVKQDQLLIELESADVQADVAQARATALVAQAKFDELMRGPRAEDVRLSETKVANAQKTLEDANINLENVKKKTDVELEDVYSGALTSSAKAISSAMQALFVITNIQITHFSGFDQRAIEVADAKAVAVQKLLGAIGYGRTTNDVISQLSGGAKEAVSHAQAEGTIENIELAVSDTKNALEAVKRALEAIPVINALSSAETTSLHNEKVNIAAELSVISGKQQGLYIQKIAAQNLVAAAEAKVNDATNVVLSAQDELALKNAGTAKEVLAAAAANIKEAEARLQGALIQFSKTMLRSPINGIVVKQDAKVGEIISMNSPLVSVISDAQFEMEAFIPEADIAKVKKGDIAKVTLDAYGDSVLFESTVSNIDPTETMVEGVATYKTTLVFMRDDARIKSGMTANIDIITNVRENVIAVPQRSVGLKENGSFVLVRDASGSLSERIVVIGLRGSDGMVEILEGLSESDAIAESSDLLFE